MSEFRTMQPNAPLAGGQGNTPMPSEEHVASAAAAAHDKVRAFYDKIQEGRQQLTEVRKEMDRLLKMGDMVTEDDVIQGAGRLVGHGLGAESMAEMLASMPTTGGQALAGWVSVHDQQVKQAEFHVKHMEIGAAHALGQAAIRSLAAAHLVATKQQPNMATQIAAAQPIQSGASTLDVEQGNPLSPRSIQ